MASRFSAHLLVSNVSKTPLTSFVLGLVFWQRPVIETDSIIDVRLQIIFMVAARSSVCHIHKAIATATKLYLARHRFDSLAFLIRLQNH